MPPRKQVGAAQRVGYPARAPSASADVPPRLERRRAARTAAAQPAASAARAAPSRCASLTGVTLCLHLHQLLGARTT